MAEQVRVATAEGKLSPNSSHSEMFFEVLRSFFFHFTENKSRNPEIHCVIETQIQKEKLMYEILSFLTCAQDKIFNNRQYLKDLGDRVIS